MNVDFGLISVKSHIKLIKLANYMTFHQNESKLPAQQNTPDSTQSLQNFTSKQLYFFTRLPLKHLPHFHPHVMFFKPEVRIGIPVKDQSLHPGSSFFRFLKDYLYYFCANSFSPVSLIKHTDVRKPKQFFYFLRKAFLFQF